MPVDMVFVLARVSSPPMCGLILFKGEVPEWTKGTDCKSVASGFGGSNPPLPTLNDCRLI